MKILRRLTESLLLRSVISQFIALLVVSLLLFGALLALWILPPGYLRGTMLNVLIGAAIGGIHQVLLSMASYEWPQKNRALPG